MSETLSGQLDEFAGEPADYDRDRRSTVEGMPGQDVDTGEVLEAKPKRRTRSDKGKPHSKHVDAFSTGQPAPGEERASVHLRHWNALLTTNPKYAKPFDTGRFKGHSVNPTWREMRMTEHFGPVGLGWGMAKPEFQLVPIEGNGELLVYCTVEVWYREEGAPVATVYGIGGDKVIRRETAGLRTSDEAFKSAFTDALGNAMKRIGVAGDVHLGLFDDDKYIREAREAFAEPASAPGNGRQQSTTAQQQFASQVPPPDWPVDNRLSRPAHEPRRPSPEPTDESEAPLTRAEWLKVAERKVIQGSTKLKEWWENDLSKTHRQMLEPDLKHLKAMAAKADKSLKELTELMRTEVGKAHP